MRRKNAGRLVSDILGNVSFEPQSADVSDMRIASRGTEP
jgi:hypothetical protein